MVPLKRKRKLALWEGSLQEVGMCVFGADDINSNLYATYNLKVWL